MNESKIDTNTKTKTTKKKKLSSRRSDKNLQDDWLPDQSRRGDATSGELPEYGGDLKEKEFISPNEKID